MIKIDLPEIKFGLEAVRQASLLVKTIQAEMVSPALTKDDRSPVTVADYASQALAAFLLEKAFPDDSLVAEEDAERRFRKGLEDYRLSLSDPVRVLFDRYRLEDWAAKVVGIGSVGTRCTVALFFSPEGRPLLLQLKEACTSVLAPYAGKSAYENQGQRVVTGQRLMQSSSDIFLGVTLPLHFHTGAVHLFTMSGCLYYTEYPEQKQTAGCYIYEPGGSIHEFNTPVSNTEDTDTFMVVFGANVNFLKDGTYINLMDSGLIKRGWTRA